MARSRPVERILCLRPDGLGDMICALPALECIAAAHPNAELVVMASPLNAPLLEGLTHVSGRMSYDPRGTDRGVNWLRRVVAEVRRRDFDMVFAFRTSSPCHVIAGLSKAPVRVGYKGKPFAWTLTHAQQERQRWAAGHEIDRNLTLLSRVGIPAITRSPRLFLSDEERRAALAWLRARGIAEDAAVIAVHPGASSDDKRWPPARFADVASALAVEHSPRAHVLVMGHASEHHVVRAVQERMTAPCEQVADVSVRLMAALFERCRLVLANDSGPMHIASSLLVPIVAVFGPTDHVRWCPQGAHARIIVADSSIVGGGPIDSIETTQVMDAAMELLGRAATRESASA